MKVAIIGAGFTGLSAAYDLLKAGVEVVIFEANDKPGGLAKGFTVDGWQWPLEEHYHHVFTTDQAVKKWLSELKLSDRLFYQEGKSYSLLNNSTVNRSFTKNYKNQKNNNPLGIKLNQADIKLAQLDSAASLLSFPGLSWSTKIRTGAVLAGLKCWPAGQCLERLSAQEFIQKTMGRASWQNLWQPLFEGKFGKHASEINAAWFWARIFTRSKKIGYFKYGFLGLAQQIVAQLQELGVEINFSTPITKIKANVDSQNSQQQSSFQLEFKNELLQDNNFDSVLFTGSSQQLLRLSQADLPTAYCSQLKNLESLSAATLILVLNKPFFKQNIYWLNINRANWPFLAVVEHTNLINKAYYNQRHLVYVGQYTTPDDKLLTMSKQEILAYYKPYLQQLCPEFKNHLQDYYLFKQDNAQPIVKQNHARILPKTITPLPGLYWAGMEHVYPYDRGINYAIQLGRATAQKIL